MEVFLLDNIFWLVTAVCSAGGLVWTFVRAGKINLSAQAAILTVNRGGVYLDIRPEAEFSEGRIPMSQNIPGSQISERGAAIAKYKKKPVVLVCANGMASRKAAQQLVKDGFERVHVLAGGIAGWRDANLPLVNKKDKRRAK